MEATQRNLRVLMFPYLAHGHISPFLELAKKLKNRNFDIYFCSTPVNLSKIAKNLADYSIEPVEYHLPSAPELPPHLHTTNGLPPNLIFSLVQALQSSGHILSNILKSLQPDLVIYDISQPWLPPIAASYGIPAVFFQTTGATVVGFFTRSQKRPDLEFPSPAIYLRDYELNAIRRVKSPSDDDGLRDRFMGCLERSNEILLIKTSKEIEGKYIDFESDLIGKRLVPVGALAREPEDDGDHPEIIQWLNGKDQASTVFVSFGSECYMSKEELHEIALGLELSNVNFIWVFRAPEGEKTSPEEALPEGFLEKVRGRGLVVEKWAPQAKILAHSSVGGFISHCGWGSVTESMNFGVPIIAMPMQYDQPLNARLLVEVGVGMEVVKGDDGRRLDGQEIARIIRQVVVEDSGEEIRRRARELGERIRMISKSGEEIDVLVKELIQLCEKNKQK